MSSTDDIFDPDISGESSGASSSVDDVPSPDVRFKSMVRQASAMSIDDIETEEAVAWVSVINVVNRQSSGEDDKSDGGAWWRETSLVMTNGTSLDRRTQVQAWHSASPKARRPSSCRMVTVAAAWTTTSNLPSLPPP